MACVVVAGLAGGCANQPASTEGGGPEVEVTDDAAASTEPTGDPAKLGCAQVPAALVKSTLGIDVSPPAEIVSNDKTECTYLSGVAGTTVIVRLQSGDNAEAFAIGRRGFDTSGQPTTDVPGLGDEAYRSSTEFDDVVTNTLVARKGSTEILVTAVASVDAEKALIQKFFESIP